MPSPRLRQKSRHDELSPTDQLELTIGAPTPELEAMWRRHGARLLRDDAEGRRFTWPLQCYGPPPGWTQQDERERVARRAEVEAGWERQRRVYQEFHTDEEAE